jgi:hypothetical protein
MGRFHATRLIGLVFAMAAASAPAMAAECTNIMPPPGFTPEQIAANKQLRSIAFAHLKKAPYDKRNNYKPVLGARFRAGDAVLGANMPREDYETFQRTLKQFDTLAQFDNEDAIAISSGDEQVQEAWQDCMKTRTGLMVWFTPSAADPREAVLTVKWSALNNYAPRQTKIKGTLQLGPGIEFVQGKDCFRDDAVVTQSGCAAMIRTPSAKTAFLAVVNSDDGEPATAYLAPRMQLEFQRSPYNAKSMVTELQSFTKEHAGESARPYLFKMAPDVARDGWRFAPSTVTLQAIATTGKEHGDCNNGRSAADDQAIRIAVSASNLTASPPQALVCYWWAQASVMRTVDLDAKR